ncbi:psbP domain-containing protein 3, chloroplastic isoform X2 [Malania oleifera]|uniref:psbP domain-containing protein 3, chloroplastic isoform X2 n=1 Tax=Malania oleifera TaxID=397392 RepID=UPI0025AEC013|nr:psbP domain-containing protein 3, chloroplastic isoform X2 [Malania oleifera]
MAPASSLSALSLLPRFFSFPAPSSYENGIKKCRDQRVFCCGNRDHHRDPCCVREHSGIRRREAMLRLALGSFSFPAAIVSDALAENDVPEGFRVYSDNLNKFNILIPGDWQVGAGEPNGFKSVTAFYPQEASSSNVSVVITGLGPDFTRLESFGKVDAFAETLVSGLDRSWQRPPGVAAKLIDCKASNGLYYIEYSLQNPGESYRHLYSAMGVASNGCLWKKIWGNMVLQLKRLLHLSGLSEEIFTSKKWGVEITFTSLNTVKSNPFNRT